MNSPIIITKKLNLYYGETKAINNCNFSIIKNKVTAIIGPSGCGKSTLLRSMNRMNDFIDSFRLDGEVLLNGNSIYDDNIDSTELRKNVGMVFQKPYTFP